MAGVFQKAMVWLGLAPDEEYDDYPYEAPGRPAPGPTPDPGPGRRRRWRRIPSCLLAAAVPAVPCGNCPVGARSRTTRVRSGAPRPLRCARCDPAP